MASRVKLIKLRPSSLLLLLFSLSYLMVLISACSSEISTLAPAPDQEKLSPAGVAEETPKETPITVDAEGGRALFTSMACTGCHTIQGIPEAQGKVGPELTHQASNSLIVDVLPNTEENLKKFLKDPAVVKPGTLMPDQGLTDSELDALVAFLRTLK